MHSLFFWGQPMWCIRFPLHFKRITFVKKGKCFEQLFFMIDVRLFFSKVKSNFNKFGHIEVTLLHRVNFLFKFNNFLLCGKKTSWSDELSYFTSIVTNFWCFDCVRVIIFLILINFKDFLEFFFCDTHHDIVIFNLNSQYYW